MKNLKQKLKSDPRIKKLVLWMIQPNMRPKPRLWIRLLVNPWVHKKGRGAKVRWRTRMDVFPFNPFVMGKWSTVEDFACINNGLGPVIIGEKSRVGISDTIIGPVTIGNNVNIAQNVVMSGLNHGYEDPDVPPREQACSTATIVVEDDCWIGANAVITAGVTVGKHSVVAAGSVVTKDVPPYSVVAGAPAKVLRTYNAVSKQWERVMSNTKSSRNEAA